MKTRLLGQGLKVSAAGIECMNFSFETGKAADLRDGVKIIHGYQKGITYLHTAELSIFLALFIVFVSGVERLSAQDRTHKQKSQVNSSQKGISAPKERFTGTAWLNMNIKPEDGYNASIGTVRFEAKARTNWHSHSSGQILFVTEGIGYYQQEGDSIQVIRKGDVIKVPKGVKHWHGSSHQSSMQHIATITKFDSDKTQWFEPVTDKEYNMSAFIAPEENYFDTISSTDSMLIRISEIEIHTQYVSGYHTILREEAAKSVQLERGVIAIFPLFLQDDSTNFRIVEIYTNNLSYQAHLKTPHFQLYKASTMKMVKSLKLVDTQALDKETMRVIFRKMN